MFRNTKNELNKRHLQLFNNNHLKLSIIEAFDVSHNTHIKKFNIDDWLDWTGPGGEGVGEQSAFNNNSTRLRSTRTYPCFTRLPFIFNYFSIRATEMELYKYTLCMNRIGVVKYPSLARWWPSRVEWTREVLNHWIDDGHVTQSVALSDEARDNLNHMLGFLESKLKEIAICCTHFLEIKLSRKPKFQKN